MNKKVIIPTIIAIITLVTLIIGATYAYFVVGTNFADYTTSISAEAEDISSVSLEAGTSLNLNLSRVDMMKQEDDVTYYGTEVGVPTIEENIVTLATAKAMKEKSYGCNYILNVAYSGNMKEAVSSEGQVILNVNGVDYDIYSTSFPLTISGTFFGINESNSKTIEGSLRLINSESIDQSAMAGTTMELTITATEFKCETMYNITYNLEGGEFSKEVKTEYSEYETYTLLTPTKEGYNFVGWTGSNGETPELNVTIPMGSTGNKNYTANWKIANTIPTFTYTGDYEIVDDEDNPIATTEGNWKIRFLSSGTLVFNELAGAENGIDVFLVGGGGGGGNTVLNTAHYFGGGGGGGGYVTTSSVKIINNIEYEIKIGIGGTSQKQGGTTSAFDLEAVGGNGASGRNGGAGGSGGGGGVAGNFGTNQVAGKGGSNGSAGNDGKSSNGLTTYSTGGTGKGESTYEFGDSSLTLYAGGGGGGAGQFCNDITCVSGVSASGGEGGGANGTKSGNGKNASDNTGGGGGGSGGNLTDKGGTGGSGIVIIRNARN